jgi:hypothetical protein
MVFGSPLWLTGLALLPILWWLHRRASRGRTVLVPSLTLFQAARRSAGVTDGTRKLDGAFWRRAALIAALVVALAAPAVLGRGSRIVVWVDDSLSMRSQEPGGTRLELACRLLAESLSARRATEVIVRSLGEPGTARRVTAPFTPATVCGARPIAPLQAPLAPLMSRADEHWLLTDGASAAVSAWAARAPLTRVLQVGAATENVAVVRVAARGDLSDPARFDVDVEVANLGRASAQRTLTVYRGDARLSSAPIALDPGARALLRTTVPAGADSAALVVQLDAGDALAEDDRLTLALPREPTVSVRVDPMCAGSLRQALRANPSLRSASPGESAELAVTCAAGSERSGPGLVIHRAASSRSVASRLRWLDEQPFPVQIPLDRLRLRAWDRPLAARSADQVVVAAGDAPLAIRRASPVSVLDTTLDLEDPHLATERAFPVLVSSLIDSAAGRELGAGYLAAREPSDSQIAPRERLTAGSGTLAPRTGLDVTPYVLALALVLMTLELAFAALTLVRDLRYYRRDS